MEAIIGKEFPQKVIPLIDGAKQSIKIVVFDWRWYPDDPGNPVQVFNQAIVRAVRRGVVVQVITNFDRTTATLINIGCEARRLISKNLVHAKLMIVDGKHIVLGSHNYTQYAFTMNFEISVLLNDCLEPAPFVEFFDNLFYGHI